MNSHIHHRTVALAFGAAALAALTLGACGDDDQAEAATDAPTPSVIEVTAVDYGYTGLPDTVPAGTRFTLANDAPAELHELVAFRLPDDEQRPVSELATLPPEQLMPILGWEPATVLLAPPGGEQIPAVGDGTLSEPGRYAVICMIPTGIDPGEYLAAAAASAGGPPQVEGGPPHIVHGMWAEITVE
jgi:hypothetical protein